MSDLRVTNLRGRTTGTPPNLPDGVVVGAAATVTDQLSIKSADASPGRVDIYCESNNSHYVRLQAPAHNEFSGNPTTKLPNLSGTIIAGDTSSAIDTNINTTGIVTAGTLSSSDLITNSLKPQEARFRGVSEFVNRQNGNNVGLVYQSGGSNIGFTTTPTGDITLNVNQIPVTSDFADHALTFSVIVSNTGTARSVTSVKLNGYTAPIKWAGGSLASAITGVTTTNGTDIYNFTGINTVGSATTTANYIVLGSVNGGYA